MKILTLISTLGLLGCATHPQPQYSDPRTAEVHQQAMKIWNQKVPWEVQLMRENRGNPAAQLAIMENFLARTQADSIADSIASNPDSSNHLARLHTT